MSKNISDIIEKFILKSLGEEATIFISRNELAQYFSVVPSQINYVLSTRFTVDKGFEIVSKRGGGGHIEVIKLNSNGYIGDIVKTSIGEEISYLRMCQILDRLVSDKLIENRESEIVKSLLADKAIVCLSEIKDFIRANQFRSYMLYLLKQ